VTDRIGSQDVQSRRKPSHKDEVQPETVFAGVKLVPETEQNDGSGDSDDDLGRGVSMINRQRRRK
jgi:hypothetical protein